MNWAVGHIVPLKQTLNGQSGMKVNNVMKTGQIDMNENDTTRISQTVGLETTYTLVCLFAYW